MVVNKKTKMAQYGEMLNVYEPEKDALYKAFADFFVNPTMTKIKDVGKFSMYMSKTYCLLNRTCRYLIAMVDRDNRSVGTLEALNSIRWDSFQTRTLSEDHGLPPHAYKARRGGMLDTPISRTKVEKEASTYNCKDLGLTITLLHTSKGSSEYGDKGTVIAALETFQTVVTFN